MLSMRSKFVCYLEIVAYIENQYIAKDKHMVPILDGSSVFVANVCRKSGLCYLIFYNSYRCKCYEHIEPSLVTCAPYSVLRYHLI